MSTNHLLRAVLGTVLCIFALGGQAWAQSPFLRGDVNCDGRHDNNDVNAINNFLFGGVILPCDDAADVNDDGIININDVNHLISFINNGLPVPAPPYPNCGYDPTADNLTCVSSCCGVARDHFQAWRLVPQTFSMNALVRDQFMSDQMQMTQIEFLSNPAQKDSFVILNPDDHLTWYGALGRDTLLTVEFYNQFGLDTVQIGSPSHLVLPTQKFPHLPPRPELDHYKAYRILNPQSFVRITTLFDQFMPTPWTVDQLTPLYFLTPASKNNEPIFDSVVHYVAYDFIPKATLGTTRQTADQFGPHELSTTNSELLMVPTYKISVRPPDEPGDTLKNHFKTWRLSPPVQYSAVVTTSDQFYDQELILQNLEFLSNPCVKDTSGIRRPDDHLNWYNASSVLPPQPLRVVFDNQFEHDTIHIAEVTHLLVPCRKDPHPAPDSLLGHYTAYRILDGTTYRRADGPIQIQDQFDIFGPELIDSAVQRLFLTPAMKNGEPQYGSDTHYVAYEIFPKSTTGFGMVRTTEDQFGVWNVQIGQPELLLVPSHKITWGPPTSDTLKNHFKTWRVNPPQPFTGLATTVDQFYDHQVFLQGLEYLSNPCLKDTSGIKRPDDHLNWYRAVSQQPTQTLRVEFNNQFQRDTIHIGPLTHLLVPCRKDPHPAPDSLLGHYTAYEILDPTTYWRSDGLQIQIQDQFDVLGPEFIDSVVQRFFLTPAQKNNEPMYGSDTHYVAYEIFPKSPGTAGMVRTTADQFGVWQLPIGNSELLLVPSHKITWGPPEDSAKNHYKSWRLEPIPFLATVDVVDQFMTDVMRLDTIDYLSNPAQKDNHPIVRPDDHLLWYGATGKNTCLRIVYDNQFGLDTFVIGQASYLLVPAQKLPHPAPDPTVVDHYKAYKVRNPIPFTRLTQIMDQFDLTGPEVVDVLTPVYFLTPASKNGEGINDSVTHYVAYQISPKDPMVNTRTAIDQFGTHQIVTQNSELLLVPTRKLQWNYNCILTVPGNVNCDAVVTSADIIHLVNYVFKGGLPPCPCIAAGDINCDGAITSADIILLVNYIFKGGPPPCDPCTIIPSLWECPC